MAEKLDNLPAHWRDRIAHIEAENLRLRESLDSLRNVVTTQRVQISSARADALRVAASIAASHCLHGDEKEYPSVIGAEIHDAIMSRMAEVERL